MPIYEYRCNACGHELEKIQRISEEPLKDCPDCGTDQLRRLVSAPGFRLKGSGWYETDFKKDGGRNLHDSHAKNDSSGSGGETKEAAKAVEPNKGSGETTAAKPSPA